VQDALPPLPDWIDEMLADLSRQASFEEIPSWLGTVCSIGQPKERKSVIFEASSDGTDRAQANRL
jgi:hypothetical protein